MAAGLDQSLSFAIGAGGEVGFASVGVCAATLISSACRPCAMGDAVKVAAVAAVATVAAPRKRRRVALVG
jgi:hypothetical protein